MFSRSLIVEYFHPTNAGTFGRSHEDCYPIFVGRMSDEMLERLDEMLDEMLERLYASINVARILIKRRGLSTCDF